MERAASRFGRKTEGAFKRVNRQGNRFRDITKGIVAGLGITRGLGLVSRGIGSVAEQFIAFDKAALGATVRFKDIGPEAANFKDQLKLIKTAARDAGATTEFTAAQAADSLDFLARAGFTSAEAMGSLGSMINLATASGEEFASVADMSSDLLGAFGLNAKDTSQKIANLNRLNDVLVKSANSANVTIESMFETMKDAAPIGRQLGIELEEVAALTAVMGNAGIKGTQAGTALKNAFLKLAAGGDPVNNMLAAIGVSVDDGTGNMRKFTDILEDVGKATGKFGTLKVAKVMDTLFGKRAIAGASNLISGISDVREFEDSLKNAGKTSQLTAEIMRTSIDAKLKSLGSAATEAGFKLFQAFAVDGKSGIDSLTEAIRALDMSGVIGLFRFFKDVLISVFNVLAMITRPFAKIASEIAQINDIVNISGAVSAIAGFAGRGISQIAGAVGLGGGEAQQPAPNAAEAQARAQQQQQNFRGVLSIAGAPPDSTFEETATASGFDVQMLGFNGA